jgi:sulfonate transport system substrate-binding protein
MPRKTPRQSPSSWKSARLDEWARNNRKDVAQLLGSYIGLDHEIAELSVSHNSYGVKPIDDEVLDQQQRIADTFLELKLIPKVVNVRNAAIGSSARLVPIPAARPRG